VTKNPGGTKLGGELRNILLHHDGPIEPMSELLLYVADRVQHIEEVIKPALAKGQVVLCDRFSDSTLAYQGYGRQLGCDKINALYQIAFGDFQPDQTFWFAGPVEILLARAKNRSEADRLEQEDVSFFQRIHDGFDALANQHSQRIVRVDATQSMDDITERVLSKMKAAQLV
jgi:dTMP kinase